MQAFMQTVRGVAAFIFIAINTIIWVIPIYLLALIRLFVPGRNERINAVMDSFISVWVGGNRAFMRAFDVSKIDAEFLGEPLRRDGWYLVVSNHQSWTDIMVLQTTLLGRIPPLKFFTKKQLIWVPGVGLAMKLLGFPYVRRFSRDEIARDPSLIALDRDAIDQACAGFMERPSSVLNFLEGTRYTKAKHANQESPYRHLLKPKAGGFAMVNQALQHRLNGVVDVTITYPTSSAPGFWDFWCGRAPRVEFRAELLPAPAPERDAVETWITSLWQQKDAYLEAQRAGNGT